MEDLSYYAYDNFTELLDFNASEDECHRGAELPFSHVYLPVLYFLIFFTGVSGNVFVIAVMRAKGAGRRLVDTFVLNLAAADLAFVFTLPLWAVSAGLEHRWDFGDALCRLSGYVVAVNRSSNVFFLACMSADRYLAVARPLARRAGRGGRGARLACAAVWASALLLGLPSLVFRRVSPPDEGGLCTEDAESAAFVGLSLASLVLAFLLPLAVVLFCYGCARRRSLRIVLAVVAAFAVSCLPFNVFRGVLVGAPALGWEFSCEARAFLARALVLSACLAFFDSCVNPLIYLLLDRHFRQRARWLCLRGLYGGEQPPPATASSRNTDGHGASTRTQVHSFNLAN
ncbi:hypothetical protein COCON_G00149160 [Conger conger]|uniref:G-protein coupled receptors family 1 profile domain-containing protein n=1 Tax=Conger conger TaxID=82655 RepID=A0A9Q1HUP6_CONCO|nr:hypothetical protein COCON_G00149160 [Conger conger]